MSEDIDESKLNPLKVNFDELYRRHLCRHGQFGINVLHLVSVVITYVSVIEILFQIPGAKWIIGAIWVSYSVLLLCNLRPGLFVLTNTGLAVLLGVSVAVPSLPVWLIWVYLSGIIASHRFQLWSHSVYTERLDMTEFHKKYPKGVRLFLVLLIYELPILLNFFLINEKEPKHASGLNDCR